MNNPAPNMAEQPVHFIREKLSAYLQEHWTGKSPNAWQRTWPITWQNMPPPRTDNTAITATQTRRLLFQVFMERVHALDLSASHYMAAGQITVTATAPKDSGMEDIDQMIDHLLKLFRGQHIGPIRIGQITMDKPRLDRGFIVHGVNLKFNIILNATINDTINDEVGRL